ncbi:MAG: C39 family peptidase [Cyanobacteria bacterium SZAS-4]|nr:C39 family peptidase [Cyanobacteria bacterium SZAS-4]
MPITSDATGLAVESKALPNKADASWRQVAADSYRDMQQVYVSSPHDRVSNLGEGTLDVPSLDGSSKSLAPSTRIFDPRESATNLAQQGVLIDQSKTDTADQQDPKTRTRPISHLTVTPATSDKSSDKDSPDFIVQSDGQIVMLKNPDNNDSGNIDIQIEQSGAQLSTAQQQSLDGLVTYLSERLMKATADGERSGSLIDESHLTSSGLETDLNLVGDSKSNNENFAPDHNDGTSQSSRTGGSSSTGGGYSSGNGGGGSGDGGSGGGGDEGYSGSNGGIGTSGRGYGSNGGEGYSGGRGSSSNESISEADFNQTVKDVVSFMNDATGPERYELVTQTSNNGYEVGPYAIGYENIVGWLQGILGNPPDLSKLDEMIKMGLLSKEMVEKIKSNGFQKFVEGLKNGEMPTADQVKNFLPKEMQEQIADGMIKDFSSQLTSKGAPDVAQIALSVELDHSATPQELTNNKQFLDQATERSNIQLNDAGSTDSVDNKDLEGMFFTQFAHPDWNPYSDALPSSSNCGPASLAMVLRVLGVSPPGVDLYGDPNPLVSQVRIMMTGDNVPGDGTNIGEVAAAADQLQLTTESVGSLGAIDQALNEGKKVVAGGDPIAYNQGMSVDQYATHTWKDENGEKHTTVFTGGHIIAVVGKDEQGNYTVMDPAYKGGILTLTPDELQGFMAPDGEYAGVAIGNP